jgi:LmbE family N-acetylglucosaminyl deacetylase
MQHNAHMAVKATVHGGSPGPDHAGHHGKVIAFVHAHPDDEALLTAGTMARAQAEGLRVILIVATDGEAGLASAEHLPHLRLMRQAELAESADILGVHRLEQLGYPDSGLHGEHPAGLAHVDSDEVAQRIAAILDDEGVDVLVGYDPRGGYGHPDHLQVHHATRRAAAIAARRPRLFEATLPREPIAAAVHAAARLHLTPSGFDPASFDQAWTPRSQISHRVGVHRYLPAKRAALRAHASQATADGSIRTLAALTRLPGPLAGLLLGTEYYCEVPAPAAVTSPTTWPTRSSAS